MKAAIAIDFWKLSIFERHLKEAGYTYTVGPGLVPETKLLSIVFEDVDALKQVVAAANAAAAKTKGK